MHAWTRAGLAVAVLGALWQNRAHATGIYVPTEELARRADLIVEGRVTSVSYLEMDGGVFSDVTLVIDGTIKPGNYNEPTITFRTPGGTIGGVQSYPEESEHFDGNEQLIVLLEQKNGQWWLPVPGYSFLIGQDGVIDQVERDRLWTLLVSAISQTTIVAPIGWGDIKDRR